MVLLFSAMALGGHVAPLAVLVGLVALVWRPVVAFKAAVLAGVLAAPSAAVLIFIARVSSPAPPDRLSIFAPGAVQHEAFVFGLVSTVTFFSACAVAMVARRRLHRASLSSS